MDPNIVTQTAIATIVTDASGTVIGWNGAATELYGWTAEEAAGRPVGDLTVPVAAAGLAESIMRRITAGETWSGAFPARRKDGSVVHVHVIGAPLRDADGTLKAIVGVSAPVPAPTLDAAPVVGELASIQTNLAEQLLSDGLVDGLTIHDADGRYLYVSPSFGTMTGHDPTALLGANPFSVDMFHLDDVARVVETQSEALETRSPWRVTYRLRRSDGAFLWVESTGTVVQAEDRLYFVVLTRDATHLESLLQGVEHERAVKQRLEEVVGQQRRFLTTISHRARTPLTAVLGMSEMLQSHAAAVDADQRRRLLDHLVASAHELRGLFEAVTDADQLSRADARLERRVVELAEVARDAARNVAADGVAEIAIPDGLRAVVDRDKVRRILEILIGNAFVHGGIGTSVTVRTEVHARGVTLVVEDSGSGVADPNKRRIFEPFERVDVDDPDPGTGLGLYVVSELAALHHGRAWVEDGKDGGAAFHVLLPRPAGPTDTIRIGSGPTPDAELPGFTPDARRFVTQLLETLRKDVAMDVAYLSVFDGEEQLVLAAAGDGEPIGVTAGARVPLGDSYCLRMVEGIVDQLISDTIADPILSDLPPTEGGIRCYVGVPLHLPTGQLFGSLCCADHRPREELSEKITDQMAIYARMLGDQLDQPGFIDRTALASASRLTALLADPGSLGIVLQPIVALTDGSITGFEALARFPESDRPTDLWFADAARAGLLETLEVLAARRALLSLAHVPTEVYLSVNLSPETICGPSLGSLLEGLPLDRLVVEITERAMIDYDRLLAALSEFRQRGLRIAIDDICTGYAGLQHVMHIRPDIIKVDRSLTQTVRDEPTHQAVLSSLVHLSRELDAHVVAEGVEDIGVLAVVRTAGATHAQGFLLGRPSHELPDGTDPDLPRLLLGGDGRS